jgi:hypothetical protein
MKRAIASITSNCNIQLSLIFGKPKFQEGVLGKEGTNKTYLSPIGIAPEY